MLMVVFCEGVQLLIPFRTFNINDLFANGVGALIGLIPALLKPTIAGLTDGQWLDVETIIDEKVVRDIIPKLKNAGAQGIIEYPLNKVVL